MKPHELSFQSSDGTVIHGYRWDADVPKAAVQIAHGAIEHAMRYDDFANSLCAQGFVVYADDHRGHGRTAGTPENVAYFGESDGGFSTAVDDLHTLTQRIREENPDLPVFLLGHSMGSLMARVYASRYGKELSGLILTGTGRVSPPLIALVRSMARISMKLRGRRHRSPFLHKLVFGTLNRPFKGETGSEFICSDEQVVKEYAQDPYCGNLSTAAFIYELLGGTGMAAAKETFARYPKDLPLFIGAGEFDSMGGSGLKAVKQDVQDFKKAGVADFEFKIYEGMRHEILNEKQKQRVYEDIIAWLTSRI
jgi:alpha-beta hydrolase superfamily lysophospholipase